MKKSDFFYSNEEHDDKNNHSNLSINRYCACKCKKNDYKDKDCKHRKNIECVYHKIKCIKCSRKKDVRPDLISFGARGLAVIDLIDTTSSNIIESISPNGILDPKLLNNALSSLAPINGFTPIISEITPALSLEFPVYLIPFNRILPAVPALQISDTPTTSTDIIVFPNLVKLTTPIIPNRVASDPVVTINTLSPISPGAVLTFTLGTLNETGTPFILNFTKSPVSVTVPVPTIQNTAFTFNGTGIASFAGNSILAVRVTANRTINALISAEFNFNVS